MKLKDVITFIKKHVTKTVLVLGLVTLTSASVYVTLNTRAKLVAVRSELAAQETLYSIVQAEKVRQDALIPVYVDSIQKRDIVIIEKDLKIKKQLKRIAVLEDSVKRSLENVSKVTASESYTAINLIIPPVAPLVFPFDSIQVKEMHYALASLDFFSMMTNELDIIITDLRQISSLKDNQIIDLNSLVNVYVSKESIFKKEAEACRIEMVGLDKAVKKQKFLKNILLPPAAVGVLVVAVQLLIK